MSTSDDWSQGRFGPSSNPTFDEQQAEAAAVTSPTQDVAIEPEWRLPLPRLRALYMQSEAQSPHSTLANLDDVRPLSTTSSGFNGEGASDGAEVRHPAQALPLASAAGNSPSAQSRRPRHDRHPAAGPSSTLFDKDGQPPAAYPNTQRYYIHARQPAGPFPPTRVLVPAVRKRILVTGGAGFLGSHLVDRLMIMGHDVLVLDNFFTGQKSNVSHWVGHPNFELVRHDVVNPILLEVDQIYHLACPASPQHYQANQIKTIKTNFMGTNNMLGLAKRTKARFLLASTSEVYGDPDVTPQKETYNGNVNQTGPRACYDEGKRVAETLTYGYHYQDHVDVRVARIFNTYGPRMNPYDGRVMSNFIIQALKGQPLTIYGEGNQTRSFCFIHDLIDGLIALMNIEGDGGRQDPSSVEPTHGTVADVHLPVNLGNGDEFTIRQLVDVIFEVIGHLRESADVPMQHVPVTQKGARVRFLSMPVDDPRQRRPDIGRAKELLDWQPTWDLRHGIREMAMYYIEQMQNGQL